MPSPKYPGPYYEIMLRIPVDTYEKLRELSNGRSMNFMMVESIKRWLENIDAAGLDFELNKRRKIDA